MTSVTVVIPTYNRSQWLGGAIESVLAQTYPDFRLIVSDNASTDSTADVVAAYHDPRLSYVRRTRNLPLNQHYNAVFATVATEYFFIVPDDDRLAPDAIERTLPVLQANPGVGVVHGQVDVVDEAGNVIATRHHMTGLGGDAIESGQEFIGRTMRSGYRVHATTAAMRTAAVRPVPLDERDFPLTDLSHWMRISLDWDMAYVARPLARYRIHGGAYSAGAAAVTDGGYIQGVDRIAKAREVKLRFLEEHGHRLTGARRLRARAQRAFRRELLDQAAHTTFPERRFVPTARAVGACARLDATTVLEPAAWRLLAGGLIGRRGVTLLKRARWRLGPSGDAAT
jgi:glycosyltransferase involved in cell wall biosynthesis